MRKKCRRISSLFMAGVMGMSLLACGSQTPVGQGTNNTQGNNRGGAATNNEYVYVPDFQYDNLFNETANSWIGSVVLQEDKVVYNRVSYDEKTGSDTYVLNERVLGDLSNEKQRSIPEFSLDGYESGLLDFCCDKNGNYYVVYNTYSLEADYPEAEYSEGVNEGMAMAVGDEDSVYSSTDDSNYLVKYDSNMNQVYSLDMSTIAKDEENSYIQKCITDNNGKVYVASNNVIYVIGEDGTHENTISSQIEFIDGLFCTEDGRVFFTGTSGSNGYVTQLIEIDTKTCSLGQEYQNLPGFDCMVKYGKNGKLYIMGTEDFYEYDLASQSSVKLLNLTECSLDKNCIWDYRILENDDILVNYSDYHGNNGLVTLKKTAASEVEVKQEIVIGSLFSGCSEIESDVIDFNKTSDKYRIVMKYYLSTDDEWDESSFDDAIALMNADLISNDGPDIIDLSYINYENLANKGVLEDLSPYLESSSILQRSDFVESLLNAYTINGKLVTIPFRFRVSTMVGKSDIVGNTTGWKMDDMIDLAKRYPDARLLYFAEPDYILTTCMRYSNNIYIDYENGTCHFDSPEFVKLLEFSKSFQNMSMDLSDSYPGMLQKEKVLLTDLSFVDVTDYQQYTYIFGDDVTNIGYPTADGSEGIFIEGIDSFAITSGSNQKEGAWAFLESVFSKQADYQYRYGFPSTTKDLEAMFEECMTPYYETDEFGNKVKDENGEYIEIPKMISQYDNYEIEVYAATQQEIDTIKFLIDKAKPACNHDEKIFMMIMEEAQAYFSGQKSAEEVAKIIQSRVDIYVSENS